MLARPFRTQVIGVFTVILWEALGAGIGEVYHRAGMLGELQDAESYQCRTLRPILLWGGWGGCPKGTREGDCGVLSALRNHQPQGPPSA